jgi:hypothetical protein
LFEGLGGATDPPAARLTQPGTVKHRIDSIDAVAVLQLRRTEIHWLWQTLTGTQRRLWMATPALRMMMESMFHSTTTATTTAVLRRWKTAMIKTTTTTKTTTTWMHYGSMNLQRATAVMMNQIQVAKE